MIKNKTFLITGLLFITLLIVVGFIFSSDQKNSNNNQEVSVDELLNAIQKTENEAGNTFPGTRIYNQETVDDWNEIYKDPFVMHIRKALDGYLNGTNAGMSVPESIINPLENDKEKITGLSSFSKDYYKSKFIVISIAGNPYGGRQINILFQDKPDKIFWVWVYKQTDGNYDLRGLAQSTKFTEEDIASIVKNDKKLLEDKEHAL